MKSVRAFFVSIAVVALFVVQPAWACSFLTPEPPPLGTTAEQLAQWRADQAAEETRALEAGRHRQAESDRRLVASSKVAYVGRIASVRLHTSEWAYDPRTIVIARSSIALRGRPPRRFKFRAEPTPGICGGVEPYTSVPEPKDVGREVLVLYGDTPSTRRAVHDIIFLDDAKAKRLLRLLTMEAPRAR